MSSLLFEIYSEEMPVSAQEFARKYFKEAYIKHLLHPLNIDEKHITIFTTHSRIAISVSNLTRSILSDATEIKGPSTDSGDKIAQKFLEKYNKSPKDLYSKTINNHEYFFVKVYKSTDTIETFIKSTTEKILHKCKWPKSMRWGAYGLKWVRPITSLLCMLDNTVIPVEFFHYKAGNETLGNRILSKHCKITINDVSKYEEVLYKNFVIAHHEIRKKAIIDQIAEIEKSSNIKIKNDGDLTNEVTGLTEWPYALLGQFNQSFLKLPEELIELVIKKHQKMFSITNNDGSLTNYFLVIANFNNDSIISGYEKVVSARLKDAESLIEHDIKIDIKNASSKLEQIIFHETLGNFKEKVCRIVGLAKLISIWVPSASIITVEGAASICKSDLITNAVKEYPELQGVMCAYYLECAGEKNVELLTALKNYQKHFNAGNIINSANPIAITLSLADKIDTLVGLIIGGKKIHSTKDPFGLRRDAISIIDTILLNNVNLPLKVIITKATDLYEAKFFRSAIIKKLTFSAANDERLTKNEVILTVSQFLLERLKSILIRNGVNPRVFDATSSNLDYPLLVEKKCMSITKFLKSHRAKELLQAYKRINNIINIKKDSINKYNANLLLESEEMQLANELERVRVGLDINLVDGDFAKCCDLLGEICAPLTNFMDRIVVNCEADDVRSNRFALISLVMSTFNRVVDFSYFLDYRL